MRAGLLAALLLLAPPAQSACAADRAANDTSRIVLALTHAPGPHEAIWLRVRVGVVPRGTRIRVLTDGGKRIGAIAPFAIAPGREAGTYTLPLPDGLVQGGRVAVRIGVENSERTTRAPTSEEVLDVSAEVVLVTR